MARTAEITFKEFRRRYIPRTLAEQSYSACAFPMGLSALSAAAWNTIPFMAATFTSAVPAGTRLLLPQGRLCTVPICL